MRNLTLALLLGAVLFVTGCDNGTNAELQSQRKSSIRDRAQTFARAAAIAPAPKLTNFPLRKALVEFTKRQDEIDHPWFVYILAQTGNAIGYYVAKTVPVNACDFLSSTEVVDVDANAVLTAPSYDGIFYGGSGSTSGCDSWFFFDSATNALIQIRGVNWYAADQPLRIEAKAIKVATGR